MKVPSALFKVFVFALWLMGNVNLCLVISVCVVGLLSIDSVIMWMLSLVNCFCARWKVRSWVL